MMMKYFVIAFVAGLGWFTARLILDYVRNEIVIPYINRKKSMKQTKHRIKEDTPYRRDSVVGFRYDSKKD